MNQKIHLQPIDRMLLHEYASIWRLDTIAQEAKLCHLYEKMGYHKTGHSEHIKNGMDIIFYEKVMDV